MSDGLDPTFLPEGLAIAAEDWQQTPPSVRRVVLVLFKRLAAREARLNQHSSTSSRPPSTEAPAIKRQQRRKVTERRRPGGQPGHPGHPQGLLAPTATISLVPDGCACGERGLLDLMPYHTPQVIELPAIRPEVTHWLLPQGRCPSCGTLGKVPPPTEQVSGYGPRLTGFGGEMAGIGGASRSAGQDLWASVCGILLSTGAIQTIVDRVSPAIVPHDDMMGQVARTVSVNDIDETAWLMHGERHWLWVMANPQGASFPIHPARSKAAFVQRIADWTGSWSAMGMWSISAGRDDGKAAWPL